MTELSNRFNNSLFTTSPTTSHLSTSSLSSHSSPINPKGDWNLREIEAKMKKGVKKEVGAASMTEQLNIFYNAQKGVAFKKLLLIAFFTYVLYWITSIQGTIFFTFLLLIASEIFSELILSFTDVGLISNVRKIQPIIYCSIFNGLLKWIAGTHNQEINWNLTSIAIISTLTHTTLNLYKPFMQLATAKIVAQAIREKNILLKLTFYPQYLIERVKINIRSFQHCLVIIGALCSVMLLLLFSFNKLTISLFQPRYVFYSCLIFVALELYLSILDFINVSLSLDPRLSRVIKNKIPVFLNLLRLQANPFNRLVQLQCLKCVFLKMEQVNHFLASETCKSLIYSTYMDILNQFSAIELEKTDKQIQKFLVKSNINDKVVNSQKSLLQDLLIYFKKLAAKITSEWQVLAILERLASLNFLFLIINKIEGEERESEVKMPIMVSKLITSIRQSVKECSERVSLPRYTRMELSNLYNSFILEKANARATRL